MKKLLKRLKEILHENKEDIQYLLFAGAPMGIVLMVLSCFMSFGELY
jgi:hypothetical protein